jgi:hypothetical protein
VEEDLRRLKQMLEAGETPVAGFPRGPEEDEEEEEEEDDDNAEGDESHA